LRLGVNTITIATLAQARTAAPEDPLEAAMGGKKAGEDVILRHMRRGPAAMPRIPIRIASPKQNRRPAQNQWRREMARQTGEKERQCAQVGGPDE